LIIDDEPAVWQRNIDVVADPRACTLARAAVRALGVVELQERSHDVDLAVSELVANAVTHGGLDSDVDAVRITVRVDENNVRVSVEQPTVADDVALSEPRLGTNRAGGFGLRMVDRLVDTWGHDAGPPGRVWFEFVRSS
jgi:anti-sigma regulatory factor (Ser/Thr protein kinase)